MTQEQEAVLEKMRATCGKWINGLRDDALQTKEYDGKRRKVRAREDARLKARAAFMGAWHALGGQDGCYVICRDWLDGDLTL